MSTDIPRPDISGTPHDPRTPRPPKVWAALLLLSLCLAGCGGDSGVEEGNPEEPAQNGTTAAAAGGQETSFADGQVSWDAIFIEETRVGHTRTRMLPAPDSDDLRMYDSEQQMSIMRQGQQIDIIVRLDSTEGIEEGLKRFRYEARTGPSPVVVDGEVVDDTLELQVQSRGQQRELSRPWEGGGGFFAVERSLHEEPLQAGESRALQSLMPGLFDVQVAENRLTAVGLEVTDLLNQPRSLLRIDNDVQMGAQSMQVVLWVDPDTGRVLKSAVPALGQVTYHGVSEAQATAPSSGGYDLGSASLVRLERPLRDAHATRRVVYRVRLDHADPADVFDECLTQTVRGRTDREAELEVRAADRDTPIPDDLEIEPPVPEDSSPSGLVQSDDPEIVALAASVAPGETDPWTVAQALEQRVRATMQPAGPRSQGFATASDVIRDPSGDCTEYAVLLAALCRAREIPARVAVGLVYFPPQQGFAFHMWNEVWVGDRWLPLDSTLGLGGIGAAHLKLVDSNLATGNANEAVLPVGQVMNQLAVEIVSVEP